MIRILDLVLCQIDDSTVLVVARKLSKLTKLSVGTVCSNWNEFRVGNEGAIGVVDNLPKLTTFEIGKQC